jgi:hypothetical protein
MLHNVTIETKLEDYMLTMIYLERSLRFLYDRLLAQNIFNTGRLILYMLFLPSV